jgi:uncharacterized protein with PIN domain
VQLAKVLKVEVGEAGAFDNRPRPREEALKKLEERAGADARRLFEAFLRKIQMAEVTIARQMFEEILRLIAELRPQPPPALA